MSFKSIKCYDNKNCVAIANEQLEFPTFFKTGDGGSNWEIVFQDRQKSYVDSLGNLIIYQPCRSAEVSYHKSGIINVIGDSGVLWQSIDDGSNWEKMKFDIKMINVFISDDYNISMFSEDFGALSFRFNVFLTMNNWSTFKSISINLPDSVKPSSFSDVICPGDGVILILGYKNSLNEYIIKSTDYGETWIAYQPIKPRAYKIFFLDENYGFAVGGRYKVNTNIYKDLIYHTSDGGQSWETQLDTIEYYPDGLKRIYFYDKNHGVAIGNWHKMWRTSNGGKSWYKDSSFNSGITADYFSDIVMLGPNEMIGLTEDGSIYKYSEKLSIDENKLKSHPEKITISPNPAGEYIEISGLNKGLQPLVPEQEIKIYNLLGECVMSAGGAAGTHPLIPSQEGNIRVDVSGLTAGVYFVRVGDWVGRFVKI
jgi:photosystem II stability/assembly factor-like uncharacterized protein